MPPKRAPSRGWKCCTPATHELIEDGGSEFGLPVSAEKLEEVEAQLAGGGIGPRQ